VPVGIHEGAEVLHCAGVTVVFTVNGTENCGLPVAGLVITEAEVVFVRMAPMPERAMEGAVAGVGVMPDSVNVAL
jgi:hypothetical protein